MIWHKAYTLADMKDLMTHDNIVEHVGIEFVEIGEDFLKLRMPVDRRTHQIHGILHGGATCVLTETAGSIASLMCVNPDTHYAVGSTITCNHLRPVKSGYVTATVCPVHLGRTKHVWDIQVHDDSGKLVAKSELTCAVTAKTSA
ncbi:MAG: hotdog fold thioesterase [Micavibrio aeruginosavorus]|uniref:Hotdog fold thioesterase n=1 Tax=Micavibrio aeruginosavorus TaxID=349221 RepID=A0A7T5R4H1_9BACT|nr:MAG: hotdog fold thioesterase [Micavibrio aeruginosavorus]